MVVVIVGPVIPFIHDEPVRAFQPDVRTECPRVREGRAIYSAGHEIVLIGIVICPFRHMPAVYKSVIRLPDSGLDCIYR